MPAPHSSIKTQRYSHQKIIFIIQYQKVLMVIGGGGWGIPVLDTSEILSNYNSNNEVWRIVSGKLPVPLHNHFATTISNRVLVFG